MGIFDIFFRRKVKTFEKINLQNLEDVAKKKISEREESFKNEATNFFEKTKQQEDKIKTDLEKLAASKTTDQVDPQLLKIAETSRKSFAKKVETLIKMEESDFSFDSLKKVCDSFSERFKEIDSSTVAEFAAIKEVFRESYSVVDDMKSLKKYFDEFGEKLKNAEAEAEPFEQIVEKIKNINDENEKLGNFKKYLENILQKNENLKKENEMLRINLQKLEESDEWKEFLVMKSKRSEKENEKTELISQVVQNFSSVERPIKKLNKILQQTNSEINMKMVEKYLSSPFDAFIEDYERNTINSVLKEAAKYIEENKIDEKKSLDRIKEMIANNTFNNLAKEWQKINSEMAELNEKIENSEVDRKRNEMLKIIAEREEEMDENKKEKIEQQMKILEQNLASEKDELQKLAKDNMSMEIEF